MVSGFDTTTEGTKTLTVTYTKDGTDLVTTCGEDVLDY